MVRHVQYSLLVGNGEIVEVHSTTSIHLIGEALRGRASRGSIESRAGRDEFGVPGDRRPNQLRTEELLRSIDPDQ